MANATTPITRALNKEFKGQIPEGLRCQITPVGSFISVRVDDPDGKLSVKLFSAITVSAARLLKEADLIADTSPMRGSQCYHMDGCVTTWELKY